MNDKEAQSGTSPVPQTVGPPRKRLPLLIVSAAGVIGWATFLLFVAVYS